MPTASEVVVSLEARVGDYLKNLDKAERQYNQHQANVLRKANVGGPEFQKALAARAAASQRTAKIVGEQQARQSRAILAGAKLQAQATENSTDRIVLALRKQRAEQDKTAKATTDSSRLVRRALGGVSLAVLTQQGLRFEEAYRDVNNTMRQYEDILGDASASTSRLVDITSEAGLPVQQLEFIMQAAARSARDLGRSGEDVFLFGEITGKAAQLANTGAAGVEGAMIQLAQAIASPRVQLQEFNSVVEGTPRLAQAFADSIEGAEGSVGKLRREIADGNVSGNQLFAGLLSQAEKIKAEFETLDLGPRQSLARLNNALAEYIGTNDTAVGTTQALAGVIDFLAENLDTMTDIIVVAGAAAAGFFGTRGLIAAATVTQSLVAQLKFVSVWAGRSALSLRTAGVAAKFFIASLGPIGVITVAVTAAAGAFALLAGRTEEAVAKYDKLNNTLTSLEAVNRQIASDETEYKELLDKTTGSLGDQKDAAIAVRDAELQAISDRILKNKELAKTYQAIAIAQVDVGQSEVNELENQRNDITGVRRRRAQNTGQGVRIAGESEAEFAERAEAAFERLAESARKTALEGGKSTNEQIKALQLIRDLETKRLELTRNRARVEKLNDAVKTETATTTNSNVNQVDLDEVIKARGIAERELIKAKEIGAKAEIARAEKNLAIIKRTVELIENGTGKDQAGRIAKDEIDPKGKSGTSSTSRTRKTDEDREKERREKAIESLREIGKAEIEQIEDLKAARLEQIAASQKANEISDKEAAELRVAISEDAAKEIRDINEKTAEEQIQLASDVRNAKADELQLVSEIAASIARMRGRAVDAVQIELDATRARYQAELDDINRVAEARQRAGLEADPQLAADRANAQAGIAGVDADEVDFREQTLSDIQGISDGAEKDDGLAGELERLEAAQDEKIRILQDFYSQDLEFKAAYEAEKAQIEAEFEEKKKQARIDSINAQIDGAVNLASAIKGVAQDGSKAAKAAAAVEKGIAIGRAVVNTAVGVSAALANPATPFPLNLISAAIVGAAGAAQVATIASQGFKDGVVSLNGAGTERSDSIPALLSKNESVITARATRGNEVGLRGLNAGLSPEQAFGLGSPKLKPLNTPNLNPLSIPSLNLSIPSVNSAGRNNFSLGGSQLSVTMGADAGLVEELRAKQAARDKGFARDVNQVIKAREKQTQSRTERM